MQCPFAVHEVSTSSAARRACNKPACCASFLEAPSAVARSRVPRESRLGLGGGNWHVAPRPRAKGERPHTGAMLFRCVRSDRNQCDTTRARKNLASCALSREAASAVARSRMPHESRLVLGGRTWHVARRPRAERERPLAGAAPFLRSAARSELARHGARAQQARVLRLLPRGSERSGAVARASRKPASSWRLQLARCTTAARRKREASRRRGAFLRCMVWPDPARHGACAQQASTLRLLSGGCERSGAVARATQKPADYWMPHLARRTTAARRRREASRRCSALLLCVKRPEPVRHGARAQEPRVLLYLPRAEEESPLVGTVPFRNADRYQAARHGAHAQQARMLRLLPRGSERSGAVARATRKPAGSWRPQLARRTMAAHGRREVSCRCSALSQYIS